MLAPERPSGRGAEKHSVALLPWLATFAGVAGVAALVGVRGDFPLSDDWSYAYTTKILSEQGRIEFLPWSGASLVLQAAYGALLSKLAGFSFSYLRLTTIVVAAIGIVGFWQLLRTVRVRGRLALLAVLLFALNPLYVNLSFTFMTDVPFTVAIVWSSVLYLKGLSERQTITLLCASLLCGASILIRQHGLFLALAAFVSCLIFSRESMRTRARNALLSVLVPVGVFAGFTAWLFLAREAPAGASNRAAEVLNLSPLEVANVGFRALAYIGLFLTPLAAAVAGFVWRRNRSGMLLGLILLTSCAVLLYVRESALMPYLTNVLYDFGLGPVTLRDTFFLGHPPPGRLGAALTLPVTIVSIAAAATLLGLWSERLARVNDAREGFLYVAACCLGMGSLLQAHLFLDRHLLPVLPIVIAATAVAYRSARPGVIAFVLIAILGWYSVAGTHDYMAWNRARWQLLTELEASGVPPEQIDGGLEYNAWRLAPKLGTWPSMEQARIGHPESEKSWWWVVEDRYLVAHHQHRRPQESRVGRYLALLDLPPSHRSLTILHNRVTNRGLDGPGD